jgi:hypothetical protein
MQYVPQEQPDEKELAEAVSEFESESEDIETEGVEE